MRNLLSEKNGRKFSLALVSLILIAVVACLIGCIPALQSIYGLYVAGVTGVFAAYAGGNVLAKKWGNDNGGGNGSR